MRALYNYYSLDLYIVSLMLFIVVGPPPSGHGPRVPEQSIKQLLPPLGIYTLKDGSKESVLN